MKELTAPTSPTKNGSNGNRKANQRSGNRTSPQKDRSPRKEKSKSFNNAPSTKSTANFANFQQPSQKLQDMSLESTSSFSYSNSTVDDAMFPYEEILLTPDNILSLKPPSPTKDSKVFASPVKQAPFPSDEKPTTLSSEAVDILELLTRKDNVIRLGQAAKKVADAQALSSAPIEIPEKKRINSSPVASPSTTIFRSPSPPTRDTNVSLTSNERFACPSFCNSPAPQNLPIPAFVDMPVQQPSSASRKVKSQSLNIHPTHKGVKPTRLNFSPKKEQRPAPELHSPQPTHITQHDVTKLLHNTEQAYAVPPANNYLDQLSHQLQSLLNIPVQS